MHPAAIPLDRSIQKLFDSCKVDDFVKFALYFPSSHPKDGPVEKDVFAPGEFGMESCSHFEQGRYPAVEGHPTLRWFCNSGDDFQESAFACTVSADDAQNIPLVNLKVDFIESPELFDGVSVNELPPSGKIDRFANDIFPLANKGLSQSCVSFVSILVPD